MAVNGVLFVLSVVAYQLPKGLGIATGARVGGFLGAGDAAGAKSALRQGLGASTLLTLAVSLLYYYRLGAIGARLLCSSEPVAAAASSDEARLALALCMNGFGLLVSCQFVLNACGRNTRATLAAFAGCWIVGVSSGALLGFGKLHWQRMGVLGLWWGNAAGFAVGGAMGMLAVSRLDLEKEVKRAAGRATA